MKSKHQGNKATRLYSSQTDGEVKTASRGSSAEQKICIPATQKSSAGLNLSWRTYVPLPVKSNVTRKFGLGLSQRMRGYEVLGFGYSNWSTLLATLWGAHGARANPPCVDFTARFHRLRARILISRSACHNYPEMDLYASGRST